MKKTLLILYSILFIFLHGNSQNLLTKKEALQTLLENNYSVRLSAKDTEIAKNNASIYNSGYLPTISLGAAAKYNNLNQEIELQNGIKNTYNNSETKNYNASVGVNYPIFTGFSRKYASKMLQEQLAISELEAKATLEEALINTYTNYYQTAELAENVQILNEALAISKQRLKRTQYQYEYGQTTKLALLNAQVDINNDSINYINAKQALSLSKRNLLLVIGDTKTQDFDVETDVDFIVLPNLEELLNNLPDNSNLQLMEKSLALNDYNIQLSKSSYFPSLGINTAYIWNTTDNPSTSQTAGMMNYGLNAGLSLNWNLFDGGARKIRYQNAQIQKETQEIRKEQLIHQLRNYLSNAYDDYQNKRFVLKTQVQNLETAQTNFKRTSEMFKTGQVSSVEYRQAQLNLLHAQTAILSAKYAAKKVELQVLQLSGKLVNTLE